MVSIRANGAKERRMKKNKRRGSEKTTDVTTTEQVQDQHSEKPELDKIVANKSNVSKMQPTANRISREQKQELILSKRAIYLAIPKSLKKRRTAAFTAIKPFLSSLQLRGLKAIAPSGSSYYALLFETEDRKDRALTKIGRSSFKWDGVMYKLIVHSFGGNPAGDEVILQISANLFATGPEVRDSIIEHYLQVDPLHSGPFIVRQVHDNDMPTGKWAVKFETKGPQKFAKQMKMGAITVLVSQEPQGTCRLCGNSGHNLFSCTTKGEKELGTESFKGCTGITPPDVETSMEE
ncbi:hypothetical protein OnM2_080052 [Erysiphe neolycopersici]|uniref:Uncharacterized protein n=1 Tax=Erysiphe neolycopersici TaxID=212602 RepID=A0A420HGE7_9PEZI|nr:hypothetical protein OnM2_080052 [Erysiphe neolycopersici]